MSVYQELVRRNVFRIAAAYVVTAWLLIQVAETVFPLFGFDSTPARIVVIASAIGFVPALVFAWTFELTPDGLRKEKDVDRSESITRKTGKKLDQTIMVVLSLGLIYFAVDKFVLSGYREASIAEQARQEGRAEAFVETYGDKSIAVLPFADMSPNKDQEYFSDGIAEELLNLLARNPQLRVVSRTTAFSLRDSGLEVPEIAKRLGVTYVLEGSVRRAGERLRITAQLIDARSDTHLWSNIWDRSLSDIFSIQEEIAEDVADEMEATISNSYLKAESADPEAFAYYLQGRHVARSGTAEGLESAIDLYQKALEIDPEYASVWSSLASVYINQASVDQIDKEDGYQRAREAAVQAISINPDDPSAHEKLGWIATVFENDLAEAARHYERALKLAPRNPGLLGNAAGLAMRLNRYDKAAALAKHSAEQEPTSAVRHYNLAAIQYYSADFGDAIGSSKMALKLSPGYRRANYILSLSLSAERRYEEALAAIEKEPLEVYRAIAVPIVYFALDRIDDADRALADLKREHEDDLAYNIAAIHAFRGSTDQAFEWLDKAVENISTSLWLLERDPLLTGLHTDQRWRPLLARANEKLGRSPEELQKIRFEFELPTYRERPMAVE